MAPTPDANYVIKIYGNAMPATLESRVIKQIILVYFPQGLLYACLVEGIWVFKRSNRYVDII